MSMQDKLVCEATFGCDPRMVLSTLHMLNRGAPPFLRLRPSKHSSAAAAFDKAFGLALPSSKRAELPICLLRDGDKETEIVFVPIYNLEHVQLPNGMWTVERSMCFWCYRVVPGCMAAAINWVMGMRMPLVLDLDDTLVVANGESALRAKRERVRPLPDPLPYEVQQRRIPPSCSSGFWLPANLCFALPQHHRRKRRHNTHRCRRSKRKRI
jgi:hypothetical protein